MILMNKRVQSVATTRPRSLLMLLKRLMGLWEPGQRVVCQVLEWGGGEISKTQNMIKKLGEFDERFVGEISKHSG